MLYREAAVHYLKLLDKQENMKADVYNQKGQQVEHIELPEEVFDLPYNGDLVHQVIVSMQANARTPVAHTKDRGEVSGGGKKPWRQKGTGRARHGSTRSPIWIGGGVTFGPRNEKNYSKKINKKMRAKALFTVLSQKMRDGEILFVDAISFEGPKTKTAKEIIDALGKVSGFEKLASKKRNAAFVAFDKKEDGVWKSFRNFGNIALGNVAGLNVLDVVQNKFLVIVNPKESVPTIAGRLQREKDK